MDNVNESETEILDFENNLNNTETLSIINYTKQTKKISKKKLFFITLIIFTVTIIGIIAYQIFCPKFKDLEIELGSKRPTLLSFVKKEKYIDNSKAITNLNKINTKKVGTKKIKLEYKGKEETVELKIVDTTAPKVEFQEVRKYIDYEIDPNDFIKEKSDLSKMTVSIKNKPKIEKFGKYKVEVIVKDEYGNQTQKECDLYITRVVKEFKLELGNKLTKEDILLNPNDKDAVDQTKIDEINTKGVGTYYLNLDFKDLKEKIKIIIEDTTAPTLTLKKLTIYEDEKINNKEEFIEQVTDASDFEVELKTEIDYSLIGKSQDITLLATDKYNNQTEQTTTLTIIQDKKAPVFYGITNLTVNKYTNVDFKKGISAIDAKDGYVDFTVDTSSVNLNAAGTYYAKYTATDKKGNKSTKNRKITVNHDQEDTNRLFDQFYNSYLSGHSVAEMAEIIKSKIKYKNNWGGDDPVWYGLTNNKGNCYVHAMILKKALDKKGVTNQLIWLTSKEHYWNLVYENGSWRHYDSTPSQLTGPATDEEKFNSSGIHQRPWDSTFPKAN